jgi:hypothetical protein
MRDVMQEGREATGKVVEQVLELFWHAIHRRSID